MKTRVVHDGSERHIESIAAMPSRQEARRTLRRDWNWYLPKWLERLPHFDHGRSLEKLDAPAVPAASA